MDTRTAVTSVLCLVTLALTSGCQLLGDEEEEPDRVVGVELACTAYDLGQGMTRTAREASGDDCESARLRPTNLRWVVTVRTPNGNTYEVEADHDERIRRGQDWP